MARSEKPSPIPDWLKPTLRRAVKGEPAPDTMDFQVVEAALAGVELEGLKKRFQFSTEEIQQSLLRVVCAVREGRVPVETFEEYPDLAAIRPSRKRETKKTESERTAIEVSMEGLPEIIPGDDESLHEFLMAARAQQARTLVPMTLASLEANVSMGKQDAISKSLEMYYHLGKRGPSVAMQFNMGNKGDGKSSDTPHFFEETILAAEKEEGSVGGEVTVFDERLLGQQEEG